jgi:UDP-2,4-diacetamido-2,4,6-trideoxy-beta-L-altropyranose hydrolase
MNVAIRADASTWMGTGHVRRMLSIAIALRSLGASVVFVSRRLDVDAERLIAGEGFPALMLAAPHERRAAGAKAHADWAGVAQERDASETVAALGDHGPIDLLMVDHYAFDAAWHRQVAAQLEVRTAIVDDLGDRPLFGHWLIDHNYHPDHLAKYSGLTNPGIEMLAGPRYAMLGPNYADAARYRFAPEVRSIGIFLGGVDERSDNIRVLRALDAIGWAGPVEIVTTSANPALDVLEAAVRDRPGVRLSRDLPDLVDFFARHDLQIGAGGGAIWERCCIGPPTVCLVCAENQRLSVPFLDAIGVVAACDLLADAPPQSATLETVIANMIVSMERRRRMCEAATKLVDGHGAKRIAEALLGGR